MARTRTNAELSFLLRCYDASLEFHEESPAKNAPCRRPLGQKRLMMKSPVSSAASSTQAATSSAASPTQAPTSSEAPAIHSPESSTAPFIQSPASSAAPAIQSPAASSAPGCPEASAAHSETAPPERCSPKMTPPTARPPTAAAPKATLAPVGQPCCLFTTSSTSSPLSGTGTAIRAPGCAPGGMATVIFRPGLFGSPISMEGPGDSGTFTTMMTPGGKSGSLGCVMP
mmetsp:Transcript_133535/g.426842  ORF Transcript_133535/g.426842 Transcript_133535/m.426842 type:complete len:228 (-) Transcript_133535:420-1103(-)